MIEEITRVVAVAGATVTIEADRQSACAQCQNQSGCGQKALAEWASRRVVNIDADNPYQVPVQVGDKVVVGLEEHSFLTASVGLYLLPISLMMFMAGVAHYGAMLAEGYVILSALAGLLVGFMAARLLSNHWAKQSRYRPIVLRLLSS